MWFVAFEWQPRMEDLLRVLVQSECVSPAELLINNTCSEQTPALSIHSRAWSRRSLFKSLFIPLLTWILFWSFKWSLLILSCLVKSVSHYSNSSLFNFKVTFCYVILCTAAHSNPSSPWLMTMWRGITLSGDIFDEGDSFKNERRQSIINDSMKCKLLN